ncbi:MAG: TetR/AcrR family transcriptional regulator [Caldisericaceae bacterium]|nr:TetR/AcrR family transcriptional regulator [Caldisericaceae bacterium]
MQKKIQTVWDSKKIQILKASQKIFARYGYFKSTMDDIAQAMGMKKGSLYYYYKSKEDILKDVVNYESEQFLNALQKEIESLKTPQEKILRFLQFRAKEFMQLMNLHQVSIQAFLEATSIVSEMYQECFEKEIDLLAQVINEGIEQGIFIECDPKKVAKSLLTFAEAVKFREFHKNKNIVISQIDYSSIEEEILFTAQIIINGISK